MIMSPSLLTMRLCEAISEQPAPSYHGHILRENTLWEHWLEDGSVISNILSVSFNMNGKCGHAVFVGILQLSSLWISSLSLHDYKKAIVKDIQYHILNILILECNIYSNT